MASGDAGPRPALEAWVYAGVTPESSAQLQTPPDSTPEEDSSGTTDSEQIRAMIQTARASEGIGRLKQNPRLDALALEHAEAMLAAGFAAHDVGQGDASQRVRRANIEYRLLGENFAQASSPEQAHRVLWQSPSHRSTLLDPRYREFGVGAARGPDGSLWVCQLFATLP